MTHDDDRARIRQLTADLIVAETQLCEYARLAESYRMVGLSALDRLSAATATINRLNMTIRDLREQLRRRARGGGVSSGVEIRSYAA